jgi:hypothetical protein
MRRIYNNRPAGKRHSRLPLTSEWSFPPIARIGCCEPSATTDSCEGDPEGSPLELLRELLPEAPVMAPLVDPSSNPAVGETTTNQMLVVARTLGLELHVLNASTVLRTRGRA